MPLSVFEAEGWFGVKSDGCSSWYKNTYVV